MCVGAVATIWLPDEGSGSGYMARAFGLGLRANSGSGCGEGEGEGEGDLAAVEDALEQVAQAVGILRAHDKVDLGHAPQQRLALLLWVGAEVRGGAGGWGWGEGWGEVGPPSCWATQPAMMMATSSPAFLRLACGPRYE